jgi:hypothetical protein
MNDRNTVTAVDALDKESIVLRGPYAPLTAIFDALQEKLAQ